MSKLFKFIRIKEAVDPSNVLWENLEVTGLERFIRSLIFVLIIIVILLVSVITIYGIRVYQDSLPTTNLELCINIRSKTYAEAVAIGTYAVDCYCAEKTFS
jgi:hypothetical protein